jgi:hypothetical protein
MDDISDRTKADIFLLNPRPMDVDSASIHGTIDSLVENRLRLMIFGDMECCEHAKTRILIMIDQIVRPSRLVPNHSICLLTIIEAHATSRYHQARAFPPYPYLWPTSS